MANRAMQQKRLKLKKERRAWAKKYAYRGMMQPNRLVIATYRNSAKGLALSMEEEDKIATALLKKEGHPPIEKRDTPKRLAALRRQAELEIDLPDGCDMFVRGPGPTNIYQESFIYFNSRKDKFVVRHRNLKEGIERRSVVYSSKELLLMCWNMDRVVWVTKKPIE